MPDTVAPQARPTIMDRDKFITETSQIVLHALLSKSHVDASDSKGLAKSARQYAVDLWRVMRHPVK